MNYLSLNFAGFVLLTVVLFYIFQRKSLGWTVLLAGSVVFYGLLSWKYLPFLAFTAMSTYLCALGLVKGKRKKLLLMLCVAANVAVWFAVKLLPWSVQLAGILANRLGISFSWTPGNILVPVGISYFTLQAIGYLADVYKGKIQPVKNVAKYLLFISYFPAIVQGPISRYDKLMPQLLNTKPYRFETMRKGLILILFGLVKKMVVADRLAIFVNACFGGYQDLTGVILYLGAVGYAIQLYMDFSGCVDICRGVSTLFNAELINNFNRPYLATSIKDFWGKWHISLSTWLKDYIYIPLGGNRKGTGRKYLNLLITFLVSGLWHGAGFRFLWWGVLHAVYQIVGQMTDPARKWVKKRIGVQEGSVSERIYQTVITFHLVTFAWIFFRSDTLVAGVEYVSNMFSEWNLYALMKQVYEMGVNANQFLFLLLHLIVFFWVEQRSSGQDRVVDGITNQHIFIRWAVYYLLILDVVLLGVYGTGYDPGGFLYGGF